MFQSFIECISLISSMIIFIDTSYYYLNRYDKRKKVFEKPIGYIDNLFDSVETFDSTLYIESPVDINHPDLNFNN